YFDTVNVQTEFENLINDDFYEIKNLNIANNNDYEKKRDEITKTLDILFQKSKDLTIDKLFRYKKIINENVSDLNKKIEKVESIYDMLENEKNRVEFYKDRVKERNDLDILNQSFYTNDSINKILDTSLENELYNINKEELSYEINEEINKKEH